MKQHLLLIFFIVGMCGCVSQQNGTNTLYEQLGGEPGITRIVDNFLYQISEDQLVLPRFANSDVMRFREKMIEHISYVSDGPVEYTGDDMVETHKDMNINPAEFNSIVENLIVAMEDADTPISAQNALLKRMALSYKDVIGEEFQTP